MLNIESGRLKMLQLLLLVALLHSALAIPVDNGVVGEPEIQCLNNAIDISFNTRNEFEGQVYVKGLWGEPGCRNDEGGRQVAAMSLTFDSCNVRRERSLNPKGVFVSTTVIVSFHPLFVTKVDRAYKIQCFYMEADKTVSTDLEVSMLTTEFRTQAVPMPICRYEILDGGPSAPVIQYAIVGQPVYHKWTCDSETVDTFCMVVYSCYVDDAEAGDRVDLIDENGCALDRNILNNPEYPSDLMAGIEAHVFKYADRPQLYFSCQIQILIKEPNDECPRPSCPEPAGRGAGTANLREEPAQSSSKYVWPLQPGSPYLPGAQSSSGSVDFGGPFGRGKRSVEVTDAGTVDVLAQLEALDIDEKIAFPNEQSGDLRMERTRMDEDKGLCMSHGKFISFAILGIGVFLLTTGTAICLLVKYPRKN